MASRRVLLGAFLRAPRRDWIRTFKMMALWALATAGAGPAESQTSAPRLIVSYVEAPAADPQPLAQRMSAYAFALRAEGAASVQVLSELGRPNRMVVLERWSNLDASADERVSAALLAAAGPAIEAPVDRRANRPLTTTLRTAPQAAGFHVLMHVDVVPEASAQASAALQAQADVVMSAPGGLGFEVGTQADRPNHFAVHEIWTSRTAYEAFAASAPAQTFRRQLATVRGAPFDDRFYLAIPDRKGQPR